MNTEKLEKGEESDMRFLLGKPNLAFVHVDEFSICPVFTDQSLISSFPRIL